MSWGGEGSGRGVSWGGEGSGRGVSWGGVGSGRGCLGAGDERGAVSSPPTPRPWPLPQPSPFLQNEHSEQPEVEVIFDRKLEGEPLPILYYFNRI